MDPMIIMEIKSCKPIMKYKSKLQLQAKPESLNTNIMGKKCSLSLLYNFNIDNK